MLQFLIEGVRMIDLPVAMVSLAETSLAEVLDMYHD